MKIVEHRRFSNFNAAGRNNKFWNATLFEDGTVEVHWGSQGTDGQRKTYPPGHQNSGQVAFERLCRKKLQSRGYRENHVLNAASASSSKKLAEEELARKAVADIVKTNNPNLQELITYFSRVNAHNIYEASGGKITYSESEGLFSTTQGIVTLSQIQEARDLLNGVAECAAKDDFSSDEFFKYVNHYLALIPQRGLVRNFDFRSMFSLAGGLRRQNDMLDALESSYASAIAASQQTDTDDPVVEDEEPLFRVELEPIDGGKEFERVRRFYDRSRGRHSDVDHFRVRRIFNLRIQHMEEQFAVHGRKMDNVWELWHGTKASNMLSILKVGMVVPPESSPHVTARMFGDGLYFADCSTKSLRYATGAWTRGGDVNRKFMMLCEVAMGRYYTPSYSLRKIPSGYDSCFAKAGKTSSLLNNEMIVYKTSQANPIRLVELTQ